MSGFEGKFVWYELMTNDAAAATAFYRAVVGWDANDAGMPGMTYMLLSVPGSPAPVAGLMALTDEARAAGAQPGWIGYVGVADADAMAARVTEEGGSVYRAPEDIPGIGRFAVVADPQGAVFCLFQPGGEMPAGAPAHGAPGTPGWRELHAGEWQAAFAFYSKLFGWTKGQSVDMGAFGTYQVFEVGGEREGGMMTRMPQTPAPFWSYYFNVEGIDPAAARVTAQGGTVINGPHEVPGGSWIVNCLDPQGVMFSLVGPKG